jgi:hypothetical protein
MCSSYLPLGVSNGLLLTSHQGHAESTFRRRDLYRCHPPISFAPRVRAGGEEARGQGWGAIACACWGWVGMAREEGGKGRGVEDEGREGLTGACP